LHEASRQLLKKTNRSVATIQEKVKNRAMKHMYLIADDGTLPLAVYIIRDNNVKQANAHFLANERGTDVWLLFIPNARSKKSSSSSSAGADVGGDESTQMDTSTNENNNAAEEMGGSVPDRSAEDDDDQDLENDLRSFSAGDDDEAADDDHSAASILNAVDLLTPSTETSAGQASNLLTDSQLLAILLRDITLPCMVKHSKKILGEMTGETSVSFSYQQQASSTAGGNCPLNDPTTAYDKLTDLAFSNAEKARDYINAATTTSSASSAALTSMSVDPPATPSGSSSSTAAVPFRRPITYRTTSFPSLNTITTVLPPSNLSTPNRLPHASFLPPVSGLASSSSMTSNLPTGQPAALLGSRATPADVRVHSIGVPVDRLVRLDPIIDVLITEDRPRSTQSGMLVFYFFYSL
jgi:hypothetical protein